MEPQQIQPTTPPEGDQPTDLAAPQPAIVEPTPVPQPEALPTAPTDTTVVSPSTPPAPEVTTAAANPQVVGPTVAFPEPAPGASQVIDPNAAAVPPTVQPPALAAMAPITSHGHKNPAVLIAVVVIVIGVLGGLGYLASTKLGKVSKEEYRLASSAASEAESKLSNMTFEVTGIESEINDSETQLINQVDKAKKSIEEYKTAYAELAKQKALKDKEVGKLFKAYETKHKTYLDQTEKYTASISSLGPVIVKCTSSLDSFTGSSATTQLATDLETCAANIKALSNLEDPEVKAYATAAQEVFSQYADILKQLAALSSRDFAKRSELNNKLFDLEDSSSKRFEDIESTLEKRFTESEPKDDLRKVSDAIFNKSLSSSK